MSLEELLVKITSRLDDKGFKELDKMETRAEKATHKLSNSLRGMFVGIIGNIGAKEILDATVKMDTLNKSFAALAGSDAGGAEQIQFLRDETQRLGQDFVTTAEAYKNLFSAGKGAGMSADEIQRVFSSVLEAGTVLGSSEQQMQGALMALEQMISKGKVSMEELRHQLGNALPGAMQTAAKAMKTTSAGLQEMLKDGLDAQKFVTAFANQLHIEFGEKAVAASKTLRAQLARLHNALFELQVAFLDGEAGESFARTIEQLTEVLRSQELQKSIKGISQGLAFLMQNAKLIGVIIAALGISRLIRLLIRVSRWIWGVGKGIKHIFKLTGKIISRFGLWKGALKILAKYGIALIPIFGDIALIIWTIVEAIKAWVNYNKKLNDEKKAPNWQKTSDGIYTDVNPKSPSFMQMGKAYYSWDDLKKELYAPQKFSDMFNVAEIERRKPTLEIYSKPVSSPSIYSAPNNVSINITTRSDNPDEIGRRVKLAMLDVFDSYNLQAGYLRPTV